MSRRNLLSRPSINTHQCRIDANRGPWQLFARAPLVTYARQRPITASHSSRYDMLAIISSRYQYGPFLFFFVAEVMSNYLTTDGLKIFFSTSGGPLRPEARGICHICHMVNPALTLILPITSAKITFKKLNRLQLLSKAYAQK